MRAADLLSPLGTHAYRLQYGEEQTMLMSNTIGYYYVT
jgi:hypothetical protein